ncbi:MAG: AAA family ATPase [Lachnospiraceae bacterium]|nr:AAA family ATPase [Lachnospiraceae bacterium]
MINIGGLKLDIEFDEIGAMHVGERSKRRRPAFDQKLAELVTDALRLAEMGGPYREMNRRFGVSELYHWFASVNEIMPVIEEELKSSGKEKLFSKNEAIAAIALNEIVKLFYFIDGASIVYGLLNGKLSYVDPLNYPMTYKLPGEYGLPGDAIYAEPEYVEEIRAYHDKYGHDLSHSKKELSQNAFYLLKECLVPVFAYDMVFRGASREALRSFYKHPSELEYNMPIGGVAENVAERLDIRLIFHMLDSVLAIFPRGSEELKRISEALVLYKSFTLYEKEKGLEAACELAGDNLLALWLYDMLEVKPFWLLIGERAWAGKSKCTIFSLGDGYSQEEINEKVDRYKEESVKGLARFYLTLDKLEEIQKRFFKLDIYFKNTVIFEQYRKLNDKLWEMLPDIEKIRDIYFEAWEENYDEFALKQSGREVTGVDAVKEIMKLYSNDPEDKTIHMIEGAKSINPDANKNQYYHNKILNKTEQLVKFIDFNGVNINDHSMEKLRAFVTSKLQMNADYDMKYDIGYPSNNLIVICEDEADFYPELMQYLNRLILGNKRPVFVRADNLLGFTEAYTTPDEEKRRKLEGLVCILDFKPHPTINVEAGTGRALEREKSEYEIYQEGWKSFLRFTRDNPRCPFIIVTNRFIFRESYKENTELIYRAFKYHVYIEAMSEEQVWERTLRMLDYEDAFSIKQEFRNELKKYIHAIYRDADLKGMPFVRDLKNRILTLFYEKLRSGHEITEDCIPKYSADAQTPEVVLESLKDLIGLENVKEKLQSIYTNLLVNKADRGKKREKRRLHMKFTGNPGTGKTTVARRLMELYYSMGLIRKKKLVEIKPSDLMSHWGAATGMKAKSVIEKAYGGVLFIDEAYAFVNNGDQGQQALDEIMIAMENHPDDLVVIMAGYKDEMRSLMKSNPGLSSRFTDEIEFADYSTEELVSIFREMCKAEDMTLADDAVHSLENCIMSKHSGEFFGNAREIRNIFTQVKDAWSRRIYGEGESFSADMIPEKREITEEDFEAIMPEKRKLGITDMIGLTELKKKLEEFKQQVVYQKFLREHGVNLPGFSMHMVFTGNPGTGKTTVAKKIAEDLYSVGILKSDRLVVAEKKDLVTGIVAETAKKTAEMVKQARGGVLFVDEAYSLTDGGKATDNGMRGHGHEAVEALLTAMEECKEDTVFIFAGYTHEMQEFLESNPGIMSRIGYTFSFEDYTPDELMEIYDSKMKAYGLVTKEAARKKIYELMSYFSEVPNFGNGRFVDHVIHQIILKRAARFDINSATGYKEILAKDIPGHKEIIETAPNRDRLYDPSEITAESKYRTAIHECGHAVVRYALNKKHVPDKISVRSGASSYGRVVFGKRTPGSLTEDELRDEIAGLLGGRNAERVFFKKNATGVLSDYDRAKRIARSMVKDYAMGELGEVRFMDILKEEDKRSTELIIKHKDFIEYFAKRLLEEKEISGEDMVKAFKEFYKKK